MGSIGVFFCLFSSALPEASERAGRIFYVTTTTSLSTVNTISFCHMLSVTNTVMGTCAARKRRQFSFNDKPFDNPTEEISPSALDIESSQEEMDQRQGRFVNYWITTTFTSPPPPSQPPPPWPPSFALQWVIPLLTVPASLCPRNIISWLIQLITSYSS